MLREIVKEGYDPHTAAMKEVESIQKMIDKAIKEKDKKTLDILSKKLGEILKGLK